MFSFDHKNILIIQSITWSSVFLSQFFWHQVFWCICCYKFNLTDFLPKTFTNFVRVRVNFAYSFSFFCCCYKIRGWIIVTRSQGPEHRLVLSIWQYKPNYHTGVWTNSQKLLLLNKENFEMLPMYPKDKCNQIHDHHGKAYLFINANKVIFFSSGKSNNPNSVNMCISASAGRWPTTSWKSWPQHTLQTNTINKDIPPAFSLYLCMISNIMWCAFGLCPIPITCPFPDNSGGRVGKRECLGTAQQ